ncbi:hypothetical protein SCARR_01152 [Pontiella sulfatireligans]|uniref:Uncharacterized protein n=1 Tax=Pontiella sulfatireligans TaxID=2750658 RepID=A0A6C2UIR2_9BACT|nr:hypothetical protein SCARR_01152 [Pontiella sulfatireligans]
MIRFFLMSMLLAFVGDSPTCKVRELIHYDNR